MSWLAFFKAAETPAPSGRRLPRRSAIYRHFSRNGQRWLIGLIVVAAAVLGLAVWTMPSPRISVVLNASTETLSFTVVNPDLAAFRVAGMRAVREDDATGECVAGIVAPAVGTTLTYLVARDDRIVIGLAPAPAPGSSARVAQISGKEDLETPLDGYWRLLSDPSCAGDKPRRLPIHGAAEFGREYSVPTATRDPLSGLLISGKLTIYGHSIESLLGFSLPRSWYEWKNIDVPAGSRISAWTDDNEKAGAVWWGVARVDLDKEKETILLNVDASTNARTMRVAIPGVPDQNGRLSFDRFSQMTSDPTIVAIQIYFGFAVVLIQTFVSLWRGIGRFGWRRSVSDDGDGDD